MKYLLDTNILSYLEEQASPFHGKVKEWFSRIPDEDELLIPILTLYELKYSVSVAPEEKREPVEALVRSLKATFPVFNLTEKGADIFGNIKAKYRDRLEIDRKKLNQHNIDLIIAGSAVAEEAVIVNNEKIFRSIQEVEPKLKLENWAE